VGQVEELTAHFSISTAIATETTIVAHAFTELVASTSTIAVVSAVRGELDGKDTLHGMRGGVIDHEEVIAGSEVVGRNEDGLSTGTGNRGNDIILGGGGEDRTGEVEDGVVDDILLLGGGLELDGHLDGAGSIASGERNGVVKVSGGLKSDGQRLVLGEGGRVDRAVGVTGVVLIAGADGSLFVAGTVARAVVVAEGEVGGEDNGDRLRDTRGDGDSEDPGAGRHSVLVEVKDGFRDRAVGIGHTIVVIRGGETVLGSHDGHEAHSVLTGDEGLHVTVLLDVSIELEVHSIIRTEGGRVIGVKLSRVNDGAAAILSSEALLALASAGLNKASTLLVATTVLVTTVVHIETKGDNSGLLGESVNTDPETLISRLNSDINVVDEISGGISTIVRVTVRLLTNLDVKIRIGFVIGSSHRDNNITDVVSSLQIIIEISESAGRSGKILMILARNEGDILKDHEFRSYRSLILG